jgi:hypothetical protein
MRRQRAALTLAALLLTVALGEPLMCIIHCDFWLPRAFGHYLAGQQHHQHQHHHNMGAEQAITAPGAAAIAPAPAGASALCFSHIGHGGGSEAPFHMPPSPIHELLPMTLALLVVALAVMRCLVAPPGDPPIVFIPPLLRPPIPSAF